jgi:hypothetical protein
MTPGFCSSGLLPNASQRANEQSLLYLLCQLRYLSKILDECQGGERIGGRARLPIEMI